MLHKQIGKAFPAVYFPPMTGRLHRVGVNALFLLFLAGMITPTTTTTNHVLSSNFLNRDVIVDVYAPSAFSATGMSLLLMNDGQLMDELGLAEMLSGFNDASTARQVCCVAIHAGMERKMEYGTAHEADYQGYGALAGNYTRFVMEELLPYVRETYSIESFYEKTFAGFSLGGLSALDIVWNYPEEFTLAGVFSGSLWWRTKAIGEGYNEDTDRIMHAQVRAGRFSPWLRFFFETGTEDETADRNNNGIIDSIDDTLALIDELVAKGYDRQHSIQYLELPDGRHDVATWARAMPVFLEWAFGG